MIKNVSTNFYTYRKCTYKIAGKSPGLTSSVLRIFRDFEDIIYVHVSLTRKIFKNTVKLLRIQMVQ
jgi:hypothetical protein